MEILFFEPVCKDYIWGGTRLKSIFKKEFSSSVVAESWEISANEDGVTKILNSSIKHKNLKELFSDIEQRCNIFGDKTKDMEKFPLLIKLIDANSNLSVQVHPNYEYAKKYENDIGKDEMWYIIDCEPNAQIIYGLKENVKQEDVEGIIRNNQIKENIKYVNIQKGDAVYIPAGTIHAILGNTLICEIQQNSNLTYRVYDWDRKDKNGRARDLHIDKAIDVIDVTKKPYIVHSQNKKNIDLIKSEFFNVKKITVEKEYKGETSKETFYTMNITEGHGTIYTNEKQYNIKKGDSFLMPSRLGKFIIKGNLEILRTSIA